MVEVLLAAAILIPGSAPGECDVDCERQSAAQLLARGETLDAIEYLKHARERFPDDRGLILLLARSYLLEDNLFWAERTLRDAVATWPDDVELRTWLAAVHLRQGDPDLVLDDLLPDLRPSEDPLRARWQLLTASQAGFSGDRAGADDALAQINRKSTLFPEDRAMWAFLRANTDPWWTESITGTLDAGLGRTSNALAGSPTDPGASGEASGLGLIDLRGRLVPSVNSSIRPAFDLEIIGHGLGNESYRDLSTLLGAFRMGAVVAKTERRLGFGYRAEVLFINQDEALYSEAHRGELEVEWANGTVVFAGGGHRAFRDERRTRWEGDLGFGGSLGRLDGAPVVAGATLRLADAESPAYDQRGISAALSARVHVTYRTALQFALSTVWDDYFNSGGEEGRLVFGTEEKRRDLLGRATIILWAPPWKSLRPRVELRYSQRVSTADTTPGFDFSYTEWRIVAWLRWSFAADPWAPKNSDADHVPLEWGLERDTGMDEDRILDLLRRDEDLRRGSSCGIP
jgi:tetratricopeptide (TPR) repeat protein